MRFLVVLTLVWYCGAQAYFPYTYGVPYPWAQQYRTDDAFGHTSFGHFTVDQNRQETRFPDGRIVGRFSYIDPKGKPSVTFYDAGPQGFRVLSNNLPVAPKPVEDTPAVVEARETLQELASRQKRSTSFFTVPVSGEGGDDDTKPFPLFYSSPYYGYAPYAPYTPYSALTHPFFQPLAAPGKNGKNGAPKATVPVPYSAFTHPFYQPLTVPSKDGKNGLPKTAVPFPLLYAQPTVVDHTFKTHQLEPADADTPADTTLIESTVKEHSVPVPSVNYFSAGSPLVYSAAVNPAFMTYGSLNPFFHPVAAPANPPKKPGYNKD